jgi:putative membrane protein
MVELLLFALAGCLMGVATGLTPGLHVNTIAVMAVELLGLEKFELAVLITSMGIVHTFVDFVPSVLLAVPSGDNLLSVLPGHRLFLRGEGHYAVMLTVWGGIAGGAMAIAVSPIFLRFMQKSSGEIAKAIPFILGGVLALMVLSERGFKKKGFALAVIALSSAMGIIALSGGGAVKSPLLALTLGFFGVAPLLHSMKNRGSAKRQTVGEKGIEGKVVLEGALLSAFGAALVSALPAVGPNQAALIVKTLVGKIKTKSYLLLLGGINTANMFFSLIVLYALGKSRTGIAAAIKQLVELQPEHMLALTGAALIAIAFGGIATLAVSKHLVGAIGRINYSKLNLLVLAGLITIVFFFSNPLGMIAFSTATLIGFGAIAFGVKRSNCMAFLMAPTILYYLTA